MYLINTQSSFGNEFYRKHVVDVLTISAADLCALFSLTGLEEKGNLHVYESKICVLECYTSYPRGY